MSVQPGDDIRSGLEENMTAMSLEQIQIQFIADWREGRSPTLQEYISKYPQFAVELTQFILCFLSTENVSEYPFTPTDMSLRALERARSSRFHKTSLLTDSVETKEVGFSEILKSLGINLVSLADTINFPGSAMLKLSRGQIEDVPPILANSIATAVQRSPEEINYALNQLRSSEYQFVGHFRATGNGPNKKKSALRTMTFRQALEECDAQGELTSEQRKLWLETE